MFPVTNAKPAILTIEYIIASLNLTIDTTYYFVVEDITKGDPRLILLLNFNKSKSYLFDIANLEI